MTEPDLARSQAATPAPRHTSAANGSCRIDAPTVPVAGLALPAAGAAVGVGGADDAAGHPVDQVAASGVVPVRRRQARQRKRPIAAPPVAGLAVPGRPVAIRRALSITGAGGKTAVAAPDALLGPCKRMAWDAFEERVLKYMISAPLIEFTLRTSKWREDFKGYLETLPKGFYLGLKTVQECDDIAKGLTSWKVEDETGELAARRAELFVSEKKAEFVEGFGLDQPRLPVKYNRSVDKTFKPQATDGKRPPWQKEPNTYTGKGETGIQNMELSKKLETLGLMRKNSYDGWDAVCASCLQWVDNAMMDSDHVQALSILRSRLMSLAEVMSTDPAVYDDLDERAKKAGTVPTPVSQFFIVKGAGGERKFQLSQEGLTAYSHNMGNLIKMCKACNQGSGKHGGDLREWLSHNPFFGPAFADKFPSGPGTGRVVEKSTSDETPADVIYAHLGGTFKSAVEASYPSRELQLFTHHTVTGNARDRFQTTGLPDDAVKQEKVEKLDIRDRRADHLVKFTTKVHKHFQKDDLPPMGSRSPEREEKDFDDYLAERETQRKKKRLRERKDYPPFFDSASQGKPTDVKSLGSSETMEVAEEANREGQQRYNQDQAAGTQAALTADLGADHSPTLATRAIGYQNGFQVTLQKRRQAFLDGKECGTARRPLALPDDHDLAVSNQLKTDYALGYNAGLLEKSSA